ncbi:MULTISPECIES: hypothetical protein [unclassified Streptomyces]|uniref:hypothetical protein n=1 Tax=unclassified Streptomyces TaxID=2593676 RepID=UPI003333825D
MDALEMRLRLTADYLKRESSTAVEELMAAAFQAVRAPTAGAGELDRRGEGLKSLPPSGGDPRSVHPTITKEQRWTRFREELKALLEAERRGDIEAAALRRIAELTELMHGEQEAQMWWDRAALQGDTIAVMMLADK